MKLTKLESSKMCVRVSPYSHITSRLKFDVPANPPACTTSPRSPCLPAPSCSLCPSPAAGSHALSQPCCHLCLLCPQVCFQITQVSPISLPLTSFSLFCSMPPVNTSQAGWRAEGGDTVAFTPLLKWEAPVQTCSWCGSVADLAWPEQNVSHLSSVWFGNSVW